MTALAIHTAQPSDLERVLSTMVVAFSTDPISRWALPEPHQYVTYFPQIVVKMGGAAFENSAAFSTDDYAGACLWLPPGVHPDLDAVGAVAEKAVAPSEQAKVFGFLEQMGGFHPTEPHWYLPFIGVDPVKQGSGYGSALLKHTLKNADRDKLPAYLEATSPGSRRLYERHGFEALGEIQSGDSPTLWPMLRKPR